MNLQNFVSFAPPEPISCRKRAAVAVSKHFINPSCCVAGYRRNSFLFILG
jgi:hypothetical protein